MMNNKIRLILLLLLASLMLLSSCAKNPALDPAQYDLPEDAETKVRWTRQLGRSLWVVKQQPEKTEPITLPETENFALRTNAFRAFFGTQFAESFMENITHVRYGGKYYIRYFDEEWLYAPDEDGQFTLWKRKGEVFRRTKTKKSEEEVKSWFFTDLSEGSVSIAMLLGVWGEPTGETATFLLYDYNPDAPRQERTVTCAEYSFHGILQYRDPETGLALITWARPETFKESLSTHADISTAAVYYIDKDPYCWQYLTSDSKEPVLGKK